MNRISRSGIKCSRLYSRVQKPADLQISRLENGLRIVSVDDLDVADFASIGVYVMAGSRYERSQAYGITHLLPNLAFKAWPGSPDMHQRVAELGGSFSAQTTRESLIYQGTMLRENISKAIDLISETVLRSEYTDQEIEDAYSCVLFNLEEGLKQPGIYSKDYLFETAYGSRGLGLNLYSANARFIRDKKSVNEYVQRMIVPSNIVVAAAGVIDHDKFVECVANSGLARIKATNAIEKPVDANYVGGTRKIPISRPPAVHPNAQQTLSYIQLGFNAPGVTEVDRGLATHVLQFLLGGGDSFSAGGPGKGMHSRLYTRVLNRYRGMESCMAFYEPFVGGGVFGISAACEPIMNKRVLDVLVAEIQSAMASTEIELNRAKNQLRSYMFSALESQSVRVENAGVQTLLRNTYISPRQVESKINCITMHDIRAILLEITRSTPSIVMMGENLLGTPDFEIKIPQ